LPFAQHPICKDDNSRRYCEDERHAVRTLDVSWPIRWKASGIPLPHITHQRLK
jgi:hypothetical protein